MLRTMPSAILADVTPRNHEIQLDESQRQTLALVPEYLAVIEFWTDEDSGAWEETRRYFRIEHRRRAHGAARISELD